MMDEVKEELNLMDEAQRELARKLRIRLTNELAMDDNVLQQIALKESERDQVLVGVLVHPEGVTSGVEIIEKQLAALETQRVGVLLTIKSSIWNSSNAVKKSHDKRNVIRARALEQDELTEA